MKITKTYAMPVPEIQVIHIKRFHDERGYFTETMRLNEILFHPELEFFKDVRFNQFNEAYSKGKTFRGLHFQWSPLMGKLVRCVTGHLIDIALDIRLGSPFFGKAVALEMKNEPGDENDTWMWVPPGFAHGTLLAESSLVEYFCTGEYSPNCQAGISPFAEDIDWSLCEYDLRKKIEDYLFDEDMTINARDSSGYSLKDWKENENSKNFIYEELK